MREMLTDKKFILQKVLLALKLLLVFSLLIFFVPILILAFFNHPSADDYTCGYLLTIKNFWNYQSFIYNNYNGRFASNFTGSVFTKNNFLYSHYYLHSLLLLLLNIASVFFLFFQVNEYLLKDKHLKKNSAFICLVFVALQYCSLVQPSTYLFWFGGAVTYQLPVILFQFQIGLWILLLNCNKLFIKFIVALSLLFIVFIINGFNELFIIAQAFLLLFIFLSALYKKISKPLLILLLIDFILSILLVLLSPGFQLKKAEMGTNGIFVGFSAVAFHIAEILWCICVNPLAWIVALIIFLYANDKQENLKRSAFIRLFIKRRWLLPLLIFLFLSSSTGIAVLWLKGNAVPYKYLNSVIAISIPLFLLFFFVEGVCSQTRLFQLLYTNSSLLFFLLALAIFTNNFINNAYKSLFSAPVYNAIMNDREISLKNASGKKATVELKSYDVALNEYIKNNYKKSSKTFNNIIQQKPFFLFYNDDLVNKSSIKALQDFYGVDSVIVK